MSADLGLAVAGAAVGFAVGGPQGAMLGWSIGSAAGSALFGPKINQEGPRLQDLSIQSSAEGQPVYKIYGTMRTAGNVFWGKPITEHKKKKKSGGKGGGGATTTTYTYTVDFAVGLCEGPITGVVKLWADGKLFYDVSALTAAEEAIVAGGGYLPDATARFQSSFGKTINIADTNGTMRIYPGSETQLPDPLIEADLGVGNTPAYRGEAYIVFDNFALKDYGNRIPNITAEVIANGSTAPQFLGTVTVPLLGLARRMRTTQYLRPDNSLLVWATGSTSTFVEVLEPMMVYPSGAISIGGRVASSQDYHLLIGDCDVPAVFVGRQSGSVYKISLYEYVAGQLVLIGTFVDETDPLGFDVLYQLHAGASSKVFYRNGEAWFHRGDTFTLYRAVPQGALSVGTPAKALVYATTSSLVAGQVKDIFVGQAELYIIHGAKPNFTLSTFDLETLVLISERSVNVTATNSNINIYSPQDGLVYAMYNSNNVAVGLYEINGSLMRDIGPLPSTTGSEHTYESSTKAAFAVHDGVCVIHYPNVIPSLGNGGYLRYWSISGLSSDAVSLSSIVSDVCASAGLDSSLINVADLASTQVRGYIRNAQMTARAALEPLAAGFFFDATESDGKIVFRKRGGATVATIDYDDLGAANPGAQEDRLVTTITQDNELPIELNLRYADPARDFQTGSQRSRRQIPASKKIDTIDMPISWSGTEAKQAVEKLHYSAWEAQTRYQFALPIKYMRLEPGDPILLPVNGVNKRVRLVKTVLLGSVIQCEAEADYAASYISEAVAADNPAGPQVIKVPGTTIMHLLDIPILQDADNDAGLYIAATGTGSGWTGAAILKSADGVAFDEVDAITTESVIGSASTLLPSGPTTIWDDGSTVGVRLIKDTLTSTTDLATLAGANTAAIGVPGRWEIVSFATATLNGDGTYTLSRLLRGRLGTEWAVGLHAIGDAFVLLEADVLARNVPATADIGVPRYYKAVSFGGDEGDVVTYTHQAVGLECYAPTHIRGRRHSPSTNDWAITWTRRTRVDGAWRDYVDVPVGEAAQSYEVDIMSGSTVKRTIAASSESATYTAAMQTTDFGSAQSTITVNIYQLSATVGRGYVGTKTL